MKIKQGYKIVVETWENDADHYQTNSVDGLTEDEVKMFVDFAKLHYSMNSPSNKGFGNMYEPDEEEEEEEYKKALLEVAKKHGKTLQEYLQKNYSMDIFDCNLNDTLSDTILCDIGICGHSEFYTRVTDSIEVFYSPVEVKLEDCTEKFC